MRLPLPGEENGVADDGETKRNVQRMNDTLRTIRVERERVRALESLASILKKNHAEAAAVKVTPPGRFRVWWRKSEMETGEPVRDVVLTDDERFEFMEWLRDQAWKRKKRADEIEATLANSAAALHGGERR